MMWKIPVVGGMEVLPQVRSALEALPRGATPARELCEQLGASFARYSRLGRLCDLASRRDFPCVRPFIFARLTCRALTG